MTGTAPATLLDPAVLARIGDLSLLARTVVDGFLHGLHRSMRIGSSFDFAEHRSYQPGDDLRRIDWRLFGRTDKYFLKTYEADTNADVLFVVDVSASMDYGSTAVTKFAYARFLAASLAWLAQRQGDRVGLATIGGDLVDVVPSSTRHLQLILHTLARAAPGGAGQLPKGLERVARFRGRSGVVVVISDCYEEPPVLEKTLGALRSRGHDVVLFHVLDPAERDLPWETAVTFEDSESGERLPLLPEELRQKYHALMAAHQQALRDGLARNRVDYVPVTTDQPLDAALHSYLDRRMLATRLR
ncbi:MAG: DUF58 domain-containing protein [Gemmatimonadales bacterium]